MGTDRRDTAWGYAPGRPFLLLVVYFGISVLQLAAVAGRPPFPDTPVTALWVLTGISLALGIAVVITWLLRTAGGLPLIVGLGMLVAAASASVSVGGQGQLVSAFYLVALGVFSGYFFSARATASLIVLATVTFGGALLVNWRLDSAAYVIAVVVLIDGVTLVVASLVQRLKSLAILDPLTGLLNRRGLADAAEGLHALDARREGTTTIVLLDLDGFKEFNDASGHDAGDRLLVDLATDWTSVLRRSDLLARTGGDEFVLVLPATDLAEAEALLARMRLANPFAWSAGIVEWSPGDSFEEAVRQADDDMYRHKASSR